VISGARQALRRAEATADSTRSVLRPGLEARNRAREIQAATRAPEAWAEAEERLADAGRAAESGELERATRGVERAVEAFGKAEDEALASLLLGEAREARARALDARADDLAPRTFGAADSLLSRATAAVLRPGRDTAAARRAADSAATVFGRSARLGARAGRARDAGRGGAEEELLEYEAALDRLAEALGLEPRPADSLDRRTERLLEAIERRRAERGDLEDELEAARRRAGSAEDRLDSLRSAHADSLARLGELAAAAERRRERERRMREIRALFADEDARVVQAGDSLKIRLTGLRFASGETEIPEEGLPLLVKVQAALRQLPGARVIVEGHTDAEGGAERNRVLSQERAIAVREHLLLSLPISADRITATGYGESRPVTTNDTEEGRARNRRIDVVLLLPERDEPERDESDEGRESSAAEESAGGEGPDDRAVAAPAQPSRPAPDMTKSSPPSTRRTFPVIQ